MVIFKNTVGSVKENKTKKPGIMGLPLVSFRPILDSMHDG
jgi:hypothetical protein